MTKKFKQIQKSQFLKDGETSKETNKTYLFPFFDIQ